MKIFEIILIVVCTLIVAGVIATRFARKKKNKSDCGSDCLSCPYRNSCASKSDERKI